MQRQLYPTLLICASFVAVVICWRPSVGEDLLALAETWSNDAPGLSVPAPTSPLGDRYGVAGNAPSYPVQGVRPASWPGAAVQQEPAPSDPNQYDPRFGPSAATGGVRYADQRYRPAPAGGPGREALANPSAPAAAQSVQRYELPPAESWTPGPAGQSGAAEPWPPRDASAPPVDRNPPPPSYRPAPRQPVPERTARANVPPTVGRHELAPRDVAPAQWPTSPPPPNAPPAPRRDIATETATSPRQEPPAKKPIPDDAIPCEGAQIVAQVGPHAILANDVWIAADMILARNRAKIPPGQLAVQRAMLIKQSFRALLKQQVETKLIYYDAMSEIPQEAMDNVEEQLGRLFVETELPKLMELWGAQSQRELDQKLLTQGMSVHRYERSFMETAMAQQWIRQKIKIDEDVNHEQMLSYYEEHLSEFEDQPRARWEQLCVRVSRYPSKEAARSALGQMGNQILDGRPFADVARELSDGPTAAEGGQRKWTNRGSLVSDVLDRAIFALPLGQLSPILDDGRTLSVVRVIERQDAARSPFVDVQVEIRDKIKQQRNQIQQQVYLDDLRRRVPVWTTYDDKPESQAMFGQTK